MWTKRALQLIEEGRTKRLRLSDSRTEAVELKPGDMSLGSFIPAAKRRKKSPSKPAQEQQEHNLVQDEVPGMQETKGSEDNRVGQHEKNKEERSTRVGQGRTGEDRRGGDNSGPGEARTGQFAESWHSARVEDPAADLVGGGGEGVGQGGGDVPETAVELTGTPERRPGAGAKVATILQPPASEGGPSPNPRTVRPGVKRLGEATVRT